MPLTASSSLMSMSLQAGEPFVVQMIVDEGEGADERLFVMSIYGPDRQVQDTIDGEQDGDLFEFIRDGTWSEGLYNKPGLKIEIAERLKNGRAVIATPSLTIALSAASVANNANGVMARSAVRINATFGPDGVVKATAAQVAYDASASVPDPDPDPDPDPNPSSASFGSTTSTWGSGTLKFGATT